MKDFHKTAKLSRISTETFVKTVKMQTSSSSQFTKMMSNFQLQNFLYTHMDYFIHPNLRFLQNYTFPELESKKKRLIELLGLGR
jgi:hypothetical protein